VNLLRGQKVKGTGSQCKTLLLAASILAMYAYHAEERKDNGTGCSYYQKQHVVIFRHSLIPHNMSEQLHFFLGYITHFWLHFL